MYLIYVPLTQETDDENRVEIHHSRDRIAFGNIVAEFYGAMLKDAFKRRFDRRALNINVYLCKVSLRRA